MLQKNLDFFQKYYKSLYHQLKTISFPVTIESSKKSIYPTIKLNNQYVYSPYDPLKEAEKLIKIASYHNQKTLIFFGYAMGYILLPLMPLKDKTLFIFEKNKNLFYESLKYIDYPVLCRENKVFFNIQDVVSLPNTEDLKDSIFFEHPFLIKNDINYYKKIKTKLKENIEHSLADLTTLGYFSPIWFRNSLLNLKNLSGIFSLKSMQNKFKGVSVCLVAGGPSLEKNLSLLKKHKDSTLIVAVGTVVKRLLKADITPHFIISTDAGFYNSWHTRNLNVSSILITDFSTHFLSSQKYSGKRAFFDYNMGYLDFIFENDFIPKFSMQPTVSAAAVEFIRFLGADTIFLFGQDFAFIDYRTHCKSTISETYALLSQTKMTPYSSREIDNIFSEQLEMTTNYKNQKIVTSLKLKLYAKEFIFQNMKIYQTSQEASKINQIPYSRNIKDSTFSIDSLLNSNLSFLSLEINVSKIQKELKSYKNLVNKKGAKELFKIASSSFLRGLRNFLEFDLKKETLDSAKIKRKIEYYIFFIEKILKNIDKV